MINNKFIGKKILVTCNNWFVGPDGKDHLAVWGTLKAIHVAEKDLGFHPQRSMANWLYEIGDMIIMGCQINYFCLCEKQPHEDVDAWTHKEGIIVSYRAPHKIFITT